MTFEEAVAVVAQHSVDELGRHMTIGAIATRVGVTENYMTKAMNKDYAEKPLRGNLIVPVTNATRNYAIVHHICEETGHVAIRLPKVDASNVDVIEHAGNAAREFGDVMAEAGKALADGRVSRDEANDFRKQANEAIAAIMQFVQLMDAKAGIVPPLQAVAKERAR